MCSVAHVETTALQGSAPEEAERQMVEKTSSTKSSPTRSVTGPGVCIFRRAACLVVVLSEGLLLLHLLLILILLLLTNDHNNDYKAEYSRSNENIPQDTENDPSTVSK